VPRETSRAKRTNLLSKLHYSIRVQIPDERVVFGAGLIINRYLRLEGSMAGLSHCHSLGQWTFN